MMAYYSILGLSYGGYYALFSDSYLTMCYVGVAHWAMMTSVQDVVHPEGKGKDKGKVSIRYLRYDS